MDANTPQDLALFYRSTERWWALAPEQRGALQLDYCWRTPETSREVAEYIGAMLRKHKGSYVRFYFGVLDDARDTLWETVVSAEGEVLGAANDTFFCPPICRS